MAQRPCGCSIHGTSSGSSESSPTSSTSTLLGNTLGFGRDGVLRQGFDPTGWNVHQILGTNIQLAHFCQADQRLHQDRGARMRGSTAEAFEIRDAGRTSSREQSLQVCSLFRRNGCHKRSATRSRMVEIRRVSVVTPGNSTFLSSNQAVARSKSTLGRSVPTQTRA